MKVVVFQLDMKNKTNNRAKEGGDRDLEYPVERCWFKRATKKNQKMPSNIFVLSCVMGEKV